MNNIVVDTNVWITAGKLAAEVETIEEADCIEACVDWTQSFLSGDQRVLVDSEGKVFDEYWTYVSQGRFPGSSLFELYTHLWERFEFIEIEFDRDGYARLPDDIDFHDRADRKFVALAISTTPYAPIINAADSDWAKERKQLEDQGLTVRELCPDLIAASLREG